MEKYSFEGFNRRYEQQKERISKIGDRSNEIIQFEEQKGKRMKVNSSETCVTPLNIQTYTNDENTKRSEKVS